MATNYVVTITCENCKKERPVTALLISEGKLVLKSYCKACNIHLHLETTQEELVRELGFLANPPATPQKQINPIQIKLSTTVH